MAGQSNTRSRVEIHRGFRGARFGNSLTLADACARLSQRLKWYGFANWQLEQVVETDEGLLAALVRDRRDRSVIRCWLDPETGTITWSEEGWRTSR